MVKTLKIRILQNLTMIPNALTNDVIGLLQDHCTVYASDIPKLVKFMLPRVNENHMSSKVLPLLGRVLSREHFMVKSNDKRSGKSIVDVTAVSQTVRQFDLKNLKKVNNFETVHLENGR